MRGQGQDDLNCPHSWHVYSPAGTWIYQGSTTDSEPWHPGVQAWLPGLFQQVLEVGGVGLSWQRCHWSGEGLGECSPPP